MSADVSGVSLKISWQKAVFLVIQNYALLFLSWTVFRKNSNCQNFCWMVRTQPIAFLKLFLLYLCNCVIKVLNKPKIIHTMYKYLLSWKAKWSWTNHSEFECAIMSLSSQKNALSLLLICKFKKGILFHSGFVFETLSFAESYNCFQSL